MCCKQSAGRLLVGAGGAPRIERLVPHSTAVSSSRPSRLRLFSLRVVRSNLFASFLLLFADGSALCWMRFPARLARIQCDFYYSSVTSNGNVVSESIAVLFCFVLFCFVFFLIRKETDNGRLFTCSFIQWNLRAKHAGFTWSMCH